MTRYTLLDVPIERNVVREVTVDGNVITGALTPLDFPERVRVTFGDSVPPRVTVDLIYAMVPEEPTEAKPTDGGTIHIGKETGRVFRIECIAPAGATGLTVRMEPEMAVLRRLRDATYHLPSSVRRPRRLAHYAMVADLLPWIDQKMRDLDRTGGALSE